MVCHSCSWNVVVHFCESCHRCHRCGSTDFQASKTQKLKGLKTIQVNSTSMKRANAVMWFTAGDIKGTDQLACVDQYLGGGGYKIFARPCPVRPRHGFVDSRVVKSREELLKVIEETAAVEPEGEVMLMLYVNATMNVVWTPGMMSVGEGHDGATAGRGIVSVPLVPAPSWVHGLVTTGKAKDAGIHENEWPYIEAVFGSHNNYERNHWWVTQLRAGPILASISPNFIPHEVMIKEIISPRGEDLVAWEARCEGIDPLTTVVWHPAGSLTDHYAVHCRQRSIPMVTTFEPQLGETLVPSGGDIERPDPKAVLRGIIKGSKIKLGLRGDATLATAAGSTIYTSDAVGLLLLGTHHSAVMAGDYGEWIGVAASLMLRLGSIALRGEARHEEGRKQHKGTREAVYSRYLNSPLSFHQACLIRLINTFRYGTFSSGGAFSKSSMGGMNWAACGQALIPLFNAVGEFTEKPNDRLLRNLIVALNRALNQAHNGGWWMNKFANAVLFKAIQEALWDQIIVSCAEGVKKVGDFKVDESEQLRLEKQWGKWKELALTPPTRPKEVTLTYLTKHSLSFSAKVRALRSPISVTVPIDTVVYDALMQDELTEKLALVSNGSAMTLKFGEKTLWTEPEVEDNPADLNLSDGDDDCDDDSDDDPEDDF